jgi:hypothetical protein
MLTYEEEIAKSADQAIADLLASGNSDYTPHREAIIETFKLLLNGNWDCTTDIDQDGANALPDLRFIQEDEYDQSMDEDDKEALGDELTYTAGHYVFEA